VLDALTMWYRIKCLNLIGYKDGLQAGKAGRSICLSLYLAICIYGSVDEA
jgi:hypothetical protein